MMAIQLSKTITGSRIIPRDLGDEKLKKVRENGADSVINSKKTKTQ